MAFQLPRDGVDGVVLEEYLLLLSLLAWGLNGTSVDLLTIGPCIDTHSFLRTFSPFSCLLSGTARVTSAFHPRAVPANLQGWPDSKRFVHFHPPRFSHLHRRSNIPKVRTVLHPESLIARPWGRSTSNPSSLTRDLRAGKAKATPFSVVAPLVSMVVEHGHLSGLVRVRDTRLFSFKLFKTSPPCAALWLCPSVVPQWWRFSPSPFPFERHGPQQMSVALCIYTRVCPTYSPSFTSPQFHQRKVKQIGLYVIPSLVRDFLLLQPPDWHLFYM